MARISGPAGCVEGRRVGGAIDAAAARASRTANSYAAALFPGNRATAQRSVARNYMERLQSLMGDPGFQRNSDAVALLAEVEAMILEGHEAAGPDCSVE